MDKFLEYTYRLGFCDVDYKAQSNLIPPLTGRSEVFLPIPARHNSVHKEDALVLELSELRHGTKFIINISGRTKNSDYGYVCDTAYARSDSFEHFLQDLSKIDYKPLANHINSILRQEKIEIILC